jgi:16S rRNA (cytidine1402-2'-O)-methyltransferase
MSRPPAGKLFLVSTPIGNREDITLRALEILKAADIIVCEEVKVGRRMLASYGIYREIVQLNEHNETEQTENVLALLSEGRSVALISDAGAPLFADPGTRLVQCCIEKDIPVTAIPGADSLIPALQLSGFSIDSFVFIGWLSQKKDIRRKQLRELTEEKRLLVFYEAPYRIRALLGDARQILGSERRAAVAFDLTMDKERVYRDTLGNLAGYFERNPRKGEFVLMVEGIHSKL